jgi:hypothetical protein
MRPLPSRKKSEAFGLRRRDKFICGDGDIKEYNGYFSTPDSKLETLHPPSLLTQS